MGQRDQGLVPTGQQRGLAEAEVKSMIVLESPDHHVHTVIATAAPAPPAPPAPATEDPIESLASLAAAVWAS